MAGRPSATATRSVAKRTRPKAVASNASRIDKLVELIDHCTLAKEAADGLGETFLSYLLSMAIQESRSAMRHTPRR